ncbi:hypothetical protein PAXRUDRAFT_780253 [Paxillus rubicundulus Ve08.2h10]|uniref:Uncharacterized protein n=1 Tax=Paxillus rubicundulus Ve08.2h10 TaxID=930991 RepID=A0A0D0CNE6_9AGAM|nr:hypothetical protein PAXRUDRAFT_780253 [Paxillus rubicundulus Ve08.2h10]
MPCILQDPSLKVEPDFENEAFLPLRNIIICNDPNQNQESAAAQLVKDHHHDCVRRLAAWQAQVKNDEELAVQAAAALQEQEAQE